MAARILHINVSGVEGGVEAVTTSLLAQQQHDFVTAIALTPTPHNQLYIQRCNNLTPNLYLNSDIARPYIPDWLFKEPSVNELPVSSPSDIPPTSGRLRTWIRRIKSHLPESLKLSLWHRKLARKTKPEIEAVLQDFKPGILHLHAGGYLWFTAAISAVPKGSGCKIILHLHNPPVLGDLSKYALQIWLRADQLLFVSGAVREAWLQQYPPLKRIPQAVVYNGIDLPEARDFTQKPPSKTIQLGMCCRLSASKAVDDVLTAFQAIHTQHPATHLNIVGDGAERQALTDLTKTLGLENAVTFHGHQENVYPFLEQFDIFIQPSRSEALGISILEAMAVSLPVIATRVGGIPEVVVHLETGFLVESGDTENLADHITNLILDPALRQQFGKTGRKRVEQMFTEHSMCESVSALYRQWLP